MPHPKKVPEILHGSGPFVSHLSPLLIAVGICLVSAAALAGQQVVVSQQENFRTEPNGSLIGVLEPGTSMAFSRRQDRWVEATLEGWVWERSLQTTTIQGYDLVVRVNDGENLRDGPSGEILGRLEDGTVLEEIGREPGWIRVRRRGWVWAASVTVDGSAAATAAPARAGAQPVSGTALPPATAEVIRGTRAILSAPDGDTLSILAPTAEVAVTARQGNWARVRVEGWVWQPPVGAGAERGDQELASPAGPSLTPADVAANPEQARGRVVTWELQFISQERAESVRTDFYEGEPFLLMRPTGNSGGRFVYVALPPDQLSVTVGMVPLERVTVVARVRTGVSQLTGSPILDLIEIRR